MKHALPDLPFSPDALAPHLSAETLHYHHDKHHRAYVDKLNQLIVGTEFETMTLEQIIQSSHATARPIFNNAAQAWNHTFYWNCLTPPPRYRDPQGTLGDAIRRQFGSIDGFKAEIAKVAGGVFGSGWAWLVHDPSRSLLSIEGSSNGDNPLVMNPGKVPLLTLDVWEHAYYIDYRNERPKYIQAVERIINWEFAETNFETSLKAAA